MSADELKAKGNASFSAGKFDEAVDHFTAAIEVDPASHVLYRRERREGPGLH